MNTFNRFLSAFIFLIFIFTGCSQNGNVAAMSDAVLSPQPTITAEPSSTPSSSPVPTITPTPEPENITITAGGDVIFENFVASEIDKNGVDSFTEDLSKVFKSSDISVVNLETAISTRGEKEKDKQFTFRADPKYLQLLNSCGINIVSLANNHSLDFGTTALEDTFASLTQRNILYAGAGKNLDEASKPVFINKSNTKVAILASSHVIPFVSWNAGANKTGLATTYDPTRLVAEIRKARAESDIVLCYIHWGEESKTMPVDYQRNLAHTYIDNGADIVIGSHPHVLQGLEFYKNKVIAYSLGNLIFTDTLKETALIKFTVNNNKTISTKVIPFEINTFRPIQIRDKDKVQNFYKNLESISFSVKINSDGDVLPKF